MQKDSWEDGVTGVQMLTTGGGSGYSKSAPSFSFKWKWRNIIMGLFWKLLLPLTLTHVSIQSTSLGRAMSLSHSEPDHFIKWTFFWSFPPQNSSPEEHLHSLERWFQMTQSAKNQKPGDLSCSPSLPKQNLFSSFPPLVSNTTGALISTKQDLHFETRYKFRQNHRIISKLHN